MMAIPSIDMEATGRNITRLRQQAGLTVRDLQEIFGFTTPQAIYKWQHGTAMPAIDNLVVLAAVLNVSINEIVIVETRELVLASAWSPVLIRRAGAAKPEGGGSNPPGAQKTQDYTAG